MMDFSADDLAGKMSGVVGGVLSAFFLKGLWYEKLAFILGGGVVSYYAGPWVSATLGLPDGLSGFLSGLFGMAVISRAWEWVQSTPIAALWAWAIDWLPRRKKDTKDTPK